MRGPTDTQRLWTELHRAGRSGIHSFDIRAQLGMGNPSQRVREIEEHHDCSVPRRREKRNGRMGIRYFHPDHSPAGLGGAHHPPGVAAEPSRATPAEVGGVAASGSRSLPDAPPDAEHDAADLGRSTDDAEQLGLLANVPAIYDEAA